MNSDSASSSASQTSSCRVVRRSPSICLPQRLPLPPGIPYVSPKDFPRSGRINVQITDPRRPYAELTSLLRLSTEPVPYESVDWDRLVARISAACQTVVVEPPPSTNGTHP
jgi:hypothetical protein